MFVVVEASNSTGHEVSAVYGPYITRSDADACIGELARRDAEAGNDPREFFAQACELPDGPGEYVTVTIDDEDGTPPFVAFGPFATREDATSEGEIYEEVLKMEML